MGIPVDGNRRGEEERPDFSGRQIYYKIAVFPTITDCGNIFNISLICRLSNVNDFERNAAQEKSNRLIVLVGCKYFR